MVQHSGLRRAARVHLRQRQPDAAGCFERWSVQYRLLTVQEFRGSREVQDAVPDGSLQPDEYRDVRSARVDIRHTDLWRGYGNGVFPEAPRVAVRPAAQLLSGSYVKLPPHSPALLI